MNKDDVARPEVFSRAIVHLQKELQKALDDATTLSAENEKLRAKVADLEGALQPFAYALETHEEVGRPYADDDRINIVQAYGCLLAELDESHFYQARQALAGDDHGHR